MGRELDMAIARALGKSVESAEKHPISYEIVPRYSTDGNSMLLLDKEMRKRGWAIYTTWEYYKEQFLTVMLHLITKKTVRVRAEEEPLTRALASYQALTGEEWTYNE